MRFPEYFEDKMVKGAFTSFTHQHLFTPCGDGETLMHDNFEYTVPYGIVGQLFDTVILYNYMKDLLTVRNQTIKEIAESGTWKEILL